MKLKDIIADEYVVIYELNRAIKSPTMYGAMLYKGNAKLLLESVMLEREVFRLFSGFKTHIIVYWGGIKMIQFMSKENGNVLT